MSDGRFRRNQEGENQCQFYSHILPTVVKQKTTKNKQNQETARAH